VCIAVAAAGWNPVTLRTEQLNNQGIGPILEEVKARQCPEWKDIANRSPMYKSYWAQWKSLTVRNGILECHRESIDGQSKIAKRILSWRRVNDMLIELHGGPSVGHLGVNKTLDKFRQRYSWLQAIKDIEKCNTCTASRSPQTRNRGQMHQYKSGLCSKG
jgi:hypothetical protein